MPFKQAFINVRTEDGHRCILMEPLVYVSNAGKTIIVPRGAQSDGASTPRVIWATLPPTGLYWKACLLHDALYRSTATDEDGNTLSLSREESDDLLLEAMVSLRVPDWQRKAIYEGVRLGGSWAFASDRASLPA